jgi:hypothetical protein
MAVMEGYMVKLGKGALGGGKRRWLELVLTPAPTLHVFKDQGFPSPAFSFVLDESMWQEDVWPSHPHSSASDSVFFCCRRTRATANTLDVPSP